MKVRATQIGYYDHVLRHEGDEFELVSDKHFAKEWMEDVDAPKAEGQKGKGGKKSKNEADAKAQSDKDSDVI